MGFFNIANTTADGTPFGYKAAKQLVDAVGLACATDRTRQSLGAILVDLDKGELTATNGHILFRATIGAEPLKDYVLPSMEYMTHGLDCPVESGAVCWVSDASAKACNCKAGWQPDDFVYPKVDAVIPTSFEHTYDCTDAMRPFFTFEVLEKIRKFYKLMGIGASGFYRFSFNSPSHGVVEKWEAADTNVTGSGVSLSPYVLILAMPAVPDFMR